MDGIISVLKGLWYSSRTAYDVTVAVAAWHASFVLYTRAFVAELWSWLWWLWATFRVVYEGFVAMQERVIVVALILTMSIVVMLWVKFVPSEKGPFDDKEDGLKQRLLEIEPCKIFPEYGILYSIWSVGDEKHIDVSQLAQIDCFGPADPALPKWAPWMAPSGVLEVSEQEKELKVDEKVKKVLDKKLGVMKMKLVGA